jgi:hypothetical protein
VDRKILYLSAGEAPVEQALATLRG